MLSPVWSIHQTAPIDPTAAVFAKPFFGVVLGVLAGVFERTAQPLGSGSSADTATESDGHRSSDTKALFVAVSDGVNYSPLTTNACHCSLSVTL